MRTIRFKRCFLPLILEGRKTQTRRLEGRYRPGEILRVNRTEIWILITRKYRQRLQDITLEDVHREGFSSPKEFRRAWTWIYGFYDPDQVVWTYEFRLISPLYLQSVYTVLEGERR